MNTTQYAVGHPCQYNASIFVEFVGIANVFLAWIPFVSLMLSIHKHGTAIGVSIISLWVATCGYFTIAISMMSSAHMTDIISCCQSEYTTMTCFQIMVPALLGLIPFPV